VGFGRFCIASILLLLVATLPILDASDHILVHATEDLILATQDQAIVILSDDDFKTQGWPGNGTPDNPYVLSDLAKDSYGVPVSIRNTKCHFVIKNSRLSSWTSQAVVLSSLCNARIENCSIRGEGEVGIHIQSSFNVSITTNLIYSFNIGVHLTQSNRSSVSENTLTLNQYGIISSSREIIIQNNSIGSNDFHLTLESEAVNNTIRFNKIIGGHWGITMENNSANNSFYGNKVGWISTGNAWDDGLSNQWDDNISMGNIWDDYSGSGIYQISGTSGSSDRFPSMLTEDILGPSIVGGLHDGLCIDYYSAPDFFRFETTVTDTSGVDTVLINANNIWYEMELNSTSEEPNRYICDVPFQGGYTYYFWANDTFGNAAMTYTAYISLGVLGPPPSSTTTVSTTNSTTSSTNGLPLLEIPVFTIGVVFAVFLVAIYTQRTVCNKGTIPSST
jgi:parallel beta-helix repeat protein